MAKEIHDNEKNITIDDIVIEKDKKKKKDNKEKKVVYFKLIVKNWIKLFLIIYLLYKLLIYYLFII